MKHTKVISYNMAPSRSEKTIDTGQSLYCFVMCYEFAILNKIAEF